MSLGLGMNQDNPIGLTHGQVILLPYTPAWERLFEGERAALQAALGGLALNIQHVGSTAIPGMVAKPILDIAIAVRDFEDGLACVVPLEKLGYEYRGVVGVISRHYFSKGEPRTHHIHMYAISSPDWENQLLFRDYLRAHPDWARAYADLKQEMAQRYSQDREAYMLAKGPFIQEILRLARGECSDP
jgi:GrpB-like predicted nucleotidyltransferase (UPF0157 family)